MLYLSSLSLSSSLLSCLLLLESIPSITCHPTHGPVQRELTIPLAHRAPRRFNAEPEVGAWAAEQGARLRSKYGLAHSDGSTSKRAEGLNLLVNIDRDTSYFGSVAIGTPPASYNVILDTGSSDLWLADSKCQIGCDGLSTFSSSNSSTLKNITTPFSVTYGSGAARGHLVQDSVQMAGFSNPKQVFALCNQISKDLLSSPISGLMGLAWRSLAASGSTPFWQALVAGGSWTSPLMSFVLTRFLDDPTAQKLEPGGVFTMGYLNSSLYTGDIEYTNINGDPTYWLIDLTSIKVQGNSVLNKTVSAAIDTGTTLVGGPPSDIANIFSQIPGSTRGSDSYQGYWIYPCSTPVNVTFAFGGGKDWSMSPADFQLQQISNSDCLGAFFEIDPTGSSPPWIIGDTFLKNVMSVFKYDPPSVGFAQLSSAARELGRNSVPTPTIGTSTVSPSDTTGAAVALLGGSRSKYWSTLAAVGAVIFVATSHCVL
ncbi:acid protease [Cantharellus anzutake]|uniref:acid protease n=1 Tax=Cantharellus anzutake TaxID=1750568 RepID=UPI0019034BDD|nr:acid protease [Cantharellus anzutake]KAF8331904.1 acid protease [Cantharellus anzutake]